MTGHAFIDDGCTLFVQEWRGIPLRPCCDEHDLAFHHSDQIADFFAANWQLAVCFFQAGVWELAIPAFLVTSTLGYAFFRFGIKAKDGKSASSRSPKS